MRSSGVKATFPAMLEDVSDSQPRGRIVLSGDRRLEEDCLAGLVKRTGEEECVKERDKGV